MVAAVAAAAAAAATFGCEHGRHTPRQRGSDTRQMTAEA